MDGFPLVIRRQAVSFESLMAVLQRLTVSVETLATLGAQLRFLQNGLEGDSRVRALLNDVVRVIDPRLLEDVEPNVVRVNRIFLACLAFILPIRLR